MRADYVKRDNTILIRNLFNVDVTTTISQIFDRLGFEKLLFCDENKTYNSYETKVTAF